MKRLVRPRRSVIYACILAVVGVAISLPILFTPAPAHASWWATSWQQRRKITFNNSASTENLVNFPVRVSLTSSQIDYSKTLAGGADIRFVDADDSTQLSYEIESWNSGGTSEIWVKVPQIDAGSSTDFIYMYYNNPAATDAQSPSNVWDSNFKMVQHLKETAACPTTFTDSTSLGNNGTCGATPTATTGEIGNARLFAKASSQYISISSVAPYVQTGDLTFSFWFNPTTTFNSSTSNKDVTLLSLADKTSSNDFQIHFDHTTGKLFASDLANVNAMSTQASWTAGTWYCVTAVMDMTNSLINLYVNGSLVGSVAGPLRSTPYSTEADIANWNQPTAQYFDGAIDEVRISASTRSASWANADYLSQSNAMNTFGSQETVPLPDAPTLIGPANNDASLLPQFTLHATKQQSPVSLQYKIDVCTASDCSVILRTIDESSSQTGWSGQDYGGGTAYVTSATLGSATIATYTYQAPALSPATQYWWRASARDPAGLSSFGPASAIQSFTTSSIPAAPTLVSPLSTGTSQVPLFQMRTTDGDGDYLQYKIDICKAADCSVIDRTIDQTASPTGWLGQDQQNSTSYTGSTVLASSAVANYQLQTPYLQPNTQYWWRAYAIDPGGSNTWSAASGISTFTTATVQVRINGGTTITGGTKFGQ